MKSTQTIARKFGTAPVFFTAISTILGAIMFLRFGFAVGNAGFIGTIFIVLIGHAVTIPTAMAIAEIATNQKVEGGGEYFIISRSFGLVIGSTIGIALYFSQAISVAFYIMAFSEAFTPLFQWLVDSFNMPTWLETVLLMKQTVGIPALLGLTFIMLTKGADLGVKTLYVVVAVLGISLAAFFLGTTEYAEANKFDPLATIGNVQIEQIIQPGPDVSQEASPPDSGDNLPLAAVGFFTVFAIIFPAFTGMTAGVGLSGDLKDPSKSIPLGTLAGTLVGMVVYIFIAYKLAISASPHDLADTSRLVMADIAWQGWIIIPLGLAAATISSALGSIMVAPRTLQAIAQDRVIPAPKITNWMAKGKGPNQEPFNASIVTIVLAGLFILMGALDSVAQIISMFFMVTYGSLCLISLLNHFAADPSYRPKFRSRWYLSFFGAVFCVGLMFFMSPLYAVIAIVVMAALYLLISYYNQDKNSLAAIFQGVIFQFSRKLHVFLQKAEKEQIRSWRPSVIALSEHSFQRLGAFDLISWISHKYGFGTYIHLIKGYVSRESNQEAQECKERIIRMAENAASNIFVDTLVSPSYTSTIAQIIQLPGIAGTENNLILFEFSKSQPANLKDIMDNLKLAKSVDFDIMILASSERGFGLKRRIHIWLTSTDYENANLMILSAYILLGHRDWKHAEIRIFAIYPEAIIEKERQRLLELIEAGQLPISPNNIQYIPHKPKMETKSIIHEKSRDADLTIIGFREKAVKHLGEQLFRQYDKIGNVLFVNATEQKNIVRASEATTIPEKKEPEENTPTAKTAIS